MSDNAVQVSRIDDGITAFVEKQKSIRRLLAATTNKVMFEKVLAFNELNVEEDEDAYRILQAAHNSWHTWRHSRPVGEYQVRFVELLLNAIGMPGLGVPWFCECDIKAFLSCVPPEWRSRLKITVPAAGLPQSLHKVLKSAKSSSAHVLAGIQQGELEQKFCYLTPRSAYAWYEFLNDPYYDQGNQCLSALERVLQSPLWTETCYSPRFKGSVMLGAGASFKDRLLCDSLHKQAKALGKPLTYFVVDYSSFILLDTLNAISIYRDDQVEHIGIEADFYDLDEHKRAFRESEKDLLAWFVPGGTLGNLNEERFFASLGSVSEPGDLLVIGVDTVPLGGRKECRSRIAAMYDKPYVRKFFAEPLAMALHGKAKASERSIKFALENARTKVVEGSDEGCSVEGSMTACITVEHGGKQKRILKSTRYEPQELVAFANRHRFAFLESFRTGRSKNFQHLAFRRFA